MCNRARIFHLAGCIPLFPFVHCGLNVLPILAGVAHHHLQGFVPGTALGSGQGHIGMDQMRDLLRQTPGVEQGLEGPEKAAAGLNHERAGDLVAISEPDKWITYY